MSSSNQIEVSPENRVCAKCLGRVHLMGRRGHGHSSSDTSCPYYFDIFQSRTSKCSRCNQPGHNRNNRTLCSLREQHPDYYYARSQPRQPRRTTTQPVRERPLQDRETLSRIYLLNACIHRLVSYINRNSFNPNADDHFYRPPPPVASIINHINREYSIPLRSIFYSINTPFRDTEHSIESINRHIDRISVSLQNYISQLDSDMLEFEQLSVLVQDILFLIHPEQQARPKRILEVNVDPAESIQEIECNICYETTDFKTICKFGCNHQFCVGCVCSLITSRNNNIHKPINCPMCRSNITIVNCHDVEQLNTIKESL